MKFRSNQLSTPMLVATIALFGTSGFAENVPLENEGASGPTGWSELSDEFAACSLGVEQSPNDIADSVTSELDEIVISWVSTDRSVVNSSHTIQMRAEGTGSVMIEGETYELQQFHFQTPSVCVGGLTAPHRAFKMFE